MAPLDIMNLSAAEGVPLIAFTMEKVIDDMVRSYNMSLTGDDVYATKFENFTNSSDGFDSEIARVYDFMFGDLISPAEREAIIVEARNEDLNRDASQSYSGSDHHSDNSDMEEALAATRLINATLLAKYEGYQRLMGYA